MTYIRSTLEMLLGDIRMDALSNMFDIYNGKPSAKNMYTNNDSFDKMFSDDDSVENKFNVQYAKLSLHSAKPEENKSCCCPKKDIILSKLSYRLKKSSSTGPKEAKNALQQATPPCSCLCSHRRSGGHVMKIIKDLGNKKLKLSVRL